MAFSSHAPEDVATCTVNSSFPSRSSFSNPASDAESESLSSPNQSSLSPTLDLSVSQSPVAHSFQRNLARNSQPRTSLNSDPIRSSVSLSAPPSANPTGQGGLSSQASAVKPRLVLSFEITQSHVSATCLSLQEKLPVQSTQTVVFDKEFPEYKTTGGSYTSYSNDGMFCLTPIEMVVKGVDKLLEKIASDAKINLQQVVAVGCTGSPHFPVLLTSYASSKLGTLAKDLPLHSQLAFPTFFSLPFLPNDDDDSASAELRMIEANFEQSCLLEKENLVSTDTSYDQGVNTLSLGKESKERSSSLLGASLSSCSIPAQLSKIRNGLAVGFVGDEQAVEKAWERTEHIMTIGTLLHSIFIGKIGNINETEATNMGFFNPREHLWEAKVLDYVSAGQAVKLGEALGQVRVSRAEREKEERVGNWLVERFGFSPDCIVTTSLPLNMSTYLAYLPKPRDAVLCFGRNDDHLLISSSTYASSSKYSILPNPIFSGKRKACDTNAHGEEEEESSLSPWIIELKSIDSAKARRIARDSFCNGKWNVLSHMCSITPAGASMAIDNPMFTISVPKGPNRGLRRFEHGVRVAEFSDTRVNSRCLVEGQAMAMRAVLSSVAVQNGRQPPNKSYRGSGAPLGFNPFCEELAPTRIYADGKASGNRSLAKIYSDCLGADVIAPFRFVEEIEKDEQAQSLEKLSGATELHDPRSRSDSIKHVSQSSGDRPEERQKLVDQVNHQLLDFTQPSKAMLGSAYFAIFKHQGLAAQQRGENRLTFTQIIRSLITEDVQGGEPEQEAECRDFGHSARSASDSMVPGSTDSWAHRRRSEEDEFNTPRPPLREFKLEEPADNVCLSGLVAAASSSDSSFPSPTFGEKDSPDSSGSTTSSGRPNNLRRQRSFTIGNDSLTSMGSCWSAARDRDYRQSSSNTSYDSGIGHGGLLLTTDSDIIQSHISRLLKGNFEAMEEQKATDLEPQSKPKATETSKERKAVIEKRSNLECEKELKALGLVKLAQRDDDAYAIYGGLLEEHMRLMEFHAQD